MKTQLLYFASGVLISIGIPCLLYSLGMSIHKALPPIVEETTPTVAITETSGEWPPSGPGWSGFPKKGATDAEWWEWYLGRCDEWEKRVAKGYWMLSHAVKAAGGKVTLPKDETPGIPLRFNMGNESGLESVEIAK